MELILPKVIMLVLHGTIFDLPDYAFRATRVYDSRQIEPLLQEERINELVAEYRLVETQAEFRKFVGIDVATNLKLLVDGYRYDFESQLQNNVELDSNKVQIALKVVSRTVNITVPFDAPQVFGWETDDKGLLFTPLPMKRDKTHYVKSIVHGYEGFQLIYANILYSRHKEALMEDLISSVGRAGILDESFRDKFWAVLRRNGVYSYGSQRAFGFFPPNYEPIWGIDDMIEFKGNVQKIMRTSDRGHPLYYEMQPLSLISSDFPLVEINSNIFNQLDDIEKKYEDVRIAIEKLIKLSNYISNYNLTDEQRHELDSFTNHLLKLNTDMKNTIKNLDISTYGSVDQLLEVKASYGNTNDTHKYRDQVNRFYQQFKRSSVAVML